MPKLPPTVATTWATLAAEGTKGPAPAFAPDTLAALPSPAARWLTRAIPAGVPLRSSVELGMTGRIRLGPRWMPFTATQILAAGMGFVWTPVVGGRLIRFVGADLLGPDDARMEFRLHGVVPVVRASGPDTARSAAGRLAAETVVWLPTAATPQLGAAWRSVDDSRAVVALPTPGGPVEVTVTVADDGRLTAVNLLRWCDGARPPAERPFGGDLAGELVTGDGVRVAESGAVGWDHGTSGWPDGCFFEFTLIGADP